MNEFNGAFIFDDWIQWWRMSFPASCFFPRREILLKVQNLRTLDILSFFITAGSNFFFIRILYASNIFAVNIPFVNLCLLYGFRDAPCCVSILSYKKYIFMVKEILKVKQKNAYTNKCFPFPLSVQNNVFCEILCIQWDLRGHA